MTSDEGTPPDLLDESALPAPEGEKDALTSAAIDAPPAIDAVPVTDVTAPKRTLVGSPTGLLLALAGMTITLYGMRYASDILNPVLLSMFLVMGMSPFIHWLRRKGLPPWATLVVVLIVFIVLILLFFAVAAISLSQLDDKLPVYKENLSAMTADIQAWLSGQGVDIGSLTSGSLSADNVMNAIGTLISGAINMLTSISLMIFVVLFMISEVFSFPRKLTDKVSIPPNFRRSLDNFSETTRTYLFTKAWLSAIMTVIVGVIYFAFGVDFALLWCVLFFVMSFIPNIGFVIAVIPPFFVTLLESGFWPAFAVLMLVIVANTIVDSVISPSIMGKSVGLSSLVVFLSLMLWAWVLGGVGALIAVPMTLMVKLLFLDSYESTRPISEFLAAGPLEEHRERKRAKKAAAAGGSGPGT